MSAELNNEGKFKSTVKGQINRLVIILVIVSLLLVGGVSCWLNYSSIISNAEIALEKTARVAADEIQYRLGSMMNIVEVLGTMEVLGDEQISLDVKRSILDEHMEAYGFRSSRIMDTQGISIFDPEKDLSARDYFKTAMTGKVAISDPIFSSTNGELIITIAAPVWEGGLRNSEIVGVVMITIDAKGLSGIAADINVSENGAAFLLNSAGTAIAHPEYSYVEEERNTIQLASSDKSLADAAAIETKMINRESGIGYQTYQGERTIVAYAPVEGLNNWSLGIYAPVSDFTQGTKLSIIIIFALLIVTLLIAVMIVQRLARSIGEPVHKCAERIALLVEGDLHSSLPTIHTENETGILVRATQEHVGSLNSILQDLDYCLDEIAKGNFAVSSNPAVNYRGDFKKISISVESICKRLNNTLSQIDQVAEQVSCSSEQVSK